MMKDALELECLQNTLDLYLPLKRIRLSVEQLLDIVRRGTVGFGGTGCG